MTSITALEFNVAMKTMNERQLFERDDAQLALLAREAEAGTGAGLQAAETLRALATEHQASLGPEDVDTVAAWLYAATCFAMHGERTAAREAARQVPSSVLERSPGLAMAVTVLGAGELLTDSHRDPDLRAFQACWQRSLSVCNTHQSAAALDEALTHLARVSLRGSRLEGSLLLGVQTAAWQLHRLAAASGSRGA